MFTKISKFLKTIAYFVPDGRTDGRHNSKGETDRVRITAVQTESNPIMRAKDFGVDSTGDPDPKVKALQITLGSCSVLTRMSSLHARRVVRNCACACCRLYIF